MAWPAEASEEGIDGFVAADAEEEVQWGESLGGVSVGGAEVTDKLLEVVLVAAERWVLIRCVYRMIHLTTPTDQDIDLGLPVQALLSCHLLSLRLSSFWLRLAVALTLIQARRHSRLRPAAHSSHCLCSHLSRIDKVAALGCLCGHRSGG